MKITFMPEADITARELAELLVRHRAWENVNIDYPAWLELAGLRRHFVVTEADERTRPAEEPVEFAD